MLVAVSRGLNGCEHSGHSNATALVVRSHSLKISHTRVRGPFRVLCLHTSTTGWLLGVTTVFGIYAHIKISSPGKKKQYRYSLLEKNYASSYYMSAWKYG